MTTSLETITAWMNVNGEVIFATRARTVLGEGPAMQVKIDPNAKYNESKRSPLGPADLRFTRKGRTLFAFVQGAPDGELVIKSLGTSSAQLPPQIVSVEFLERDKKLAFRQGAEGLRVKLPSNKPATADLGITLKVHLV